MSENCVHKPDIRFGKFLRQYFLKDDILSQTMHCVHCGGEIQFNKKSAHKLWDALIWVILLAVIIAIRLGKDMMISYLPLWAYILIAVAFVALLGLVLDVAKEWYLIKHGRFILINSVAAEPIAGKNPAE